MLYRQDDMMEHYSAVFNSDIDKSDDFIKFMIDTHEKYKGFKNTFKKLIPDIDDFNFEPFYYSENTKQEVPDSYLLKFKLKNKRIESFRHLSSGTQNIFLLLFYVMSMKSKPLLAVEELENGIHMSLYHEILNVLAQHSPETKIIITTHSNTLSMHFDANYYSSFYIGKPNDNGYAEFLPLKKSMRENIKSIANEFNKSISETVFSMLTGTPASKEEIKGWLSHE
jgi:hypothetical protein